MELECLKFNEKMKAEGAVCRHPDDYCKYRTSCFIYFIEKENARSRKETLAVEDKENNNDTPVTDD